jgi:hypothetical protein
LARCVWRYERVPHFPLYGFGFAGFPFRNGGLSALLGDYVQIDPVDRECRTFRGGRIKVAEGGLDPRERNECEKKTRAVRDYDDTA